MIYLDNNATTPLHPKVKEKIISFLNLFGNPSSAYQTGREVKYLVEDARNKAANS